MGDSLRWLMATVGLRVETFASADEFLGAPSPRGPGCLVLDVRMPGTSGLDLFEKLVRRGGTLPTIFITAFADVPMAIRAMKSGAAEFVEKPFNRQTLLEKVQRAVRDDIERHRVLACRGAIRARFLSLTEEGARGPRGDPRRRARTRGSPPACTSRRGRSRCDAPAS